MTFALTSSAYRRHRWVVTRGGRQRVVDLDWPGFSNWIAVDGAVVQRWSWPGNNLHTTRSFSLDGVRATVIRQRTGLLSYAVTLVVQAPDALVREVAPDGQGLAPVAPPSQAALVAGVAIPLAVVALTLGVPLVVTLLVLLLPEHRDQLIGLLIPATILLAPLAVLAVVVALVVIALRSARS